MQTIIDVVFSALENKYENAEKEKVAQLVKEEWERLFHGDNILHAVSVSCQTEDLETDVKNQVKCICYIEKVLRFMKPDENFIEQMYAVVFGTEPAFIQYRTDEYVKDFGGVVPGRITEIGSELKSLNDTLQQISKMDHKAKSEKALFISKIFTNLIIIHPFVDGNGRVARMLVQYCARFWGYRFFVIPKVRNCKNWKKALQNGIRGDYNQIQHFFMEKLIKD